MRLTIRDIQKMRDDNTRITVVTAYDAPTARLAEQAQIPMILVGDSVGMVVQGHKDPIPVRLEHMIYHGEIVTRNTDKPLVVVDLPFMTYATPEMALMNAARLMQEARASAVKMEGGNALVATVKRVVDAGIPVMAHIGLTPQSVNQLGGWRVQGRDIGQARQLVVDALALQQAGAFAIVLEVVPARLAGLITRLLTIPTIGIGAGGETSGQVQVIHDLIALFSEFLPRHARRYADAGEVVRNALASYRTDVEEGQFPTSENSFSITDEVMNTLLEEFDEGLH